ncbi:hypothetical protein PHLGIDRAFT_505344 [Phlebiopsis gigantea 11061_1 CR5-6]|uniref:Transcription factor IIIC putative zinc-finger domain-containing protein n=1 Tax=Phlebiopsis gigantea (strain 11061_1 CR5-6) TaxID=745531 RepID=A0A0C3NVA1_PHLG1|nr:hypothetical protein PHLGIDRAFT_505344 [Phlebiopsis gigantea 11061_1 CR5-6]
MSAYPILTALGLPAVSSFPSAECLQWSDDGQAVLLTRNAIYIMTPEPGIAVDTSSVVKQNLDRSLTLNSQKPIGWLRTMIEGDKGANLHQWVLTCQDWAAASLGSMDISFTAVACSPSNLSADAGCVYAILDSNHEVHLFHAVKNPLTGQWVKVNTVSLRISRARISWSPQPDFGMSPAPDVDGSLLAVGNKAGHVDLMRFPRFIHDSLSAGAYMEHVRMVPAGDRWITHVAWSSPTCISPGISRSYLACALADGSIVVVAVDQSLVPRTSSPALSPEYDIAVAVDDNDEQVLGADSRGVASLRWPILVFTKPGLVYLWSKPSAFAPWSDVRSIRLETQNLSVASTAFSRVSGIAYAQRRDALVISLADGSFHVIQQLSTNPLLVSGTSTDQLSSGAVSRTARAVFSKVEEEEVTRSDVNAIHGLTSYDGDAFYTWIHEAIQPNDFSYKHDAKHSHIIVTAQLWDGKSDDDILADIHTALSQCTPSRGVSPLSTLRAIFLQLRDRDKLARLHPRVLALLRAPPAPDAPAAAPTQWAGEAGPALRVAFRRSLRMHLFGRAGFLARRVRVLLAGFCQKQSADGEEGEKFATAQAEAVAELWPEVLRIVIRHVVAVSRLMTEEDVPFVFRVVVQALLVGVPADVQAEAQALRAQIQHTVPHIDALGLDEQCPACHAAVPLSDITTATCAAGHVWARCSVTSFILSTPMVRTCVGCKRKAFLAPPAGASSPSWLPPSARSWIVEELLHAARRCFFCGCSFVSLV